MKNLFAVLSTCMLVTACQTTTVPQAYGSASANTVSKFNDLWMSSSKTQLHDVDVTSINFKPVPDNFQQKASTYIRTISDNVGPQDWAMNKNSDVCVKQIKAMPKSAQVVSRDNPIRNHVCVSYVMNTFYRAPYLSKIQEILDTWTEMPVEKFATSRKTPRTDNSELYIYWLTINHLAVHYAMHRDQYTNQEAIDTWLTNWMMQNQNANGRDSRKCPQNNPSLYKQYPKKQDWDGDACGTLAWTSSAARIALGMATNNQTLYTSGVRFLEIQMSMFDDNGVYVPLANRAFASITYTTDLYSYIDTLAIIYEQVGIDFYQVKNSHGMTMEQALVGTTTWLKDPSLNPYLLRSWHGPSTKVTMFPYSEQEWEYYWKNADSSPLNVYCAGYTFIDKYNTVVTGDFKASDCNIPLVAGHIVRGHSGFPDKIYRKFVAQ